MQKGLPNSNSKIYKSQLVQRALIDINELLSDGDCVDYSPPHETAQLQVQVQTPDSQIPDSEDTSISNAGTVTDSSLDSSSIEVLQPNTGLQIQLPINPPP